MKKVENTEKVHSVEEVHRKKRTKKGKIRSSDCFVSRTWHSYLFEVAAERKFLNICSPRFWFFQDASVFFFFLWRWFSVKKKLRFLISIWTTRKAPFIWLQQQQQQKTFYFWIHHRFGDSFKTPISQWLAGKDVWSYLQFSHEISQIFSSIKTCS